MAAAASTAVVGSTRGFTRLVARGASKGVKAAPSGAVRGRFAGEKVDFRQRFSTGGTKKDGAKEASRAS